MRCAARLLNAQRRPPLHQFFHAGVGLRCAASSHPSGDAGVEQPDLHAAWASLAAYDSEAIGALLMSLDECMS